MPAYPIQNYRVRGWFELEGDKTFRMDYPLNSDSIVVDAGGYVGDFAQAIHDRYRCNVYVFEPHPDFYDGLVKRFAKIPKIRVFRYGLSDRNDIVPFSTQGDATSMFAGDAAGVSGEVRDVSEVFRDFRFDTIDLMKINVEGAEYDIIDSLHASGLINKVQNYQVQFHDFIPNAVERVRRARSILQDSHFPTYMFAFVWENWARKSSVDLSHLSQTLFSTIDSLRETICHRERDIDDLKERVENLERTLAELRQSAPARP